MYSETIKRPFAGTTLLVRAVFIALASVVFGVLVWQAVTASGNPSPTDQAAGSFAGILDIGVLVFREGLECILVLSAITASMTGAKQTHRRPVAIGAGVAFGATLK